jgi:hypothetical protein
MSSIDFLHDPSPPMSGWALLVVGAAALIATAAVDNRYAAARVEADQAAQAQSDLERQRRQPVRATPPTASEIRLRQAQAESHAPWLATLRAIEVTSQDPIYLRSLVIEPAAAVVKLEAEAPSFAEALSYAKALDDVSLLHPALLVSHEEVADTATGKNVVRFSVVTRWNSR